MKRLSLIVLSLLLILGVAGHAQTIGLADISANGSFSLSAGQTLTLRAQIVGCNGDIPQYQGNPISITPNQTPSTPFTADASQAVNFTLPGNDQVLCGGQPYTRYAITWYINGFPAAPTKIYRFVDGTSVSLNTLTANQFVPPVIQNSMGDACPGGQALNGYNANFTPICVTTSGTGQNATFRFNGTNLSNQFLLNFTNSQTVPGGYFPLNFQVDSNSDLTVYAALPFDICSFPGAAFGDKIVNANAAAIAAGGGVLSSQCIEGQQTQTTGTQVIEIGSPTVRVFLKLASTASLSVTQTGNNLSTPAATSVSTSTAASGLGAATYYVKIAYYNGGLSAASSEMTATLSSTGYLTVTSPPSIAHSYSYNVYVSTSSGAETWQANCLIGQSCNVGQNYPFALYQGFPSAPTVATGSPAFMIHGGSGSGIICDNPSVGCALKTASTMNVSDVIETEDEFGSPTLKNIFINSNTGSPGTVTDSTIRIQSAFNETQVDGIYGYCIAGVPFFTLGQSNDLHWNHIQMDGVGRSCSPMFQLDPRQVFGDTGDQIANVTIDGLQIVNPAASGVMANFNGAAFGTGSGVVSFASNIVLNNPSFENNTHGANVTAIQATNIRGLHLTTPSINLGAQNNTSNGGIALSFSETTPCTTQAINLDNPAVFDAYSDVFIHDTITPETITAPATFFSSWYPGGYHLGAVPADNCPSTNGYVRGMQQTMDTASAVPVVPGLPTGCLQFPCAVAVIVVTGQQANIGNTTLYSPTPGQYKASCTIVETQAATTSSTLPSCTIAASDPTIGNSVFYANVSGSTSNTVGAFNLLTAAMDVTNNHSIQYATNSYASSGATPMQYKVVITLERIK